MDDFHAIKGVVSNLGLADMTQKAHKLQYNALHANLQKIEEEKEELLTALNEFLSFKII
jgi:HPt (histidine-containing phosphotransfer) domain-containing protein